MPLLDLFKSDPVKQAAYPMYREAGEKARRVRFFTEFDVVDDFDGRFDLLVLHVHLLIRRLRRLGTTYQQITDDFLLARAQEMLENDELAIKQVAASLGFDNPANFGKAFRRWCGMSPGSYRKRQVRTRFCCLPGTTSTSVHPSRSWSGWAAVHPR